MTDGSRPTRWEELRAFGREILGRVLDILRPAMLLYTLLVLGVGGLGTWGAFVALRHGKASVREVVLSAATYAIALCVTAVADSLLDRKADTLFRLFVLVLAIIALVPVGYPVFLLVLTGQIATTLAASTIVYYLAPPFLVWAVANSRDEKFDKSRWDAPMGGSPTRDLEDKNRD